MDGNGDCAQCHGTGVNTQVDSANPKCAADLEPPRAATQFNGSSINIGAD